jgi:hypothetical protein
MCARGDHVYGPDRYWDEDTGLWKEAMSRLDNLPVRPIKPIRSSCSMGKVEASNLQKSSLQEVLPSTT